MLNVLPNAQFLLTVFDSLADQLLKTKMYRVLHVPDALVFTGQVFLVELRYNNDRQSVHQSNLTALPVPILAYKRRLYWFIISIIFFFWFWHSRHLCYHMCDIIWYVSI